MTSAAIYSTDFPALKDTDTVADATRRMLADRVSDLPVVDGAGKLVGMFKIERLFAVLLPKAAAMNYGMPDLAFVSDTVEQLKRRMREIENSPVREFMIKPDHIVHPKTSPLEIVLLLYKGANAIPVVAEATGELVGMVTARDILAALQPEGAR
jgi:CBS-domain-containing membrane protein